MTQAPMPGWFVWVGMASVVVMTGFAILMLVGLFGSGSEQDRVRLSAIQLAGSVGLGTGGMFALYLAARRQQTNEQMAADTRHDATERRITELYSTAAEQLASDKAPVRIAALLTLERLAQDNPSHRQTVVDLLCAYLRMPFVPPGEPEDVDGTETTHDVPGTPEAASGDSDGNRQEQEVRLTAERILTRHLRPKSLFDEDESSTNAAYWSDISLDLTGAVLVDWDMNGCHVREAQFFDTQFLGYVSFMNSEFQGSASFLAANFGATAVAFDGAIFHDDAAFSNASFCSSTSRFGVVDGSVSTTFRCAASFRRVTFHGNANFIDTEFHGGAVFRSVRFEGFADLIRAKFYAVDFEAANVSTYGVIDLREALVTHPQACTLPEGWTVGGPLKSGDTQSGEWFELVELDQTVI